MGHCRDELRPFQEGQSQTTHDHGAIPHVRTRLGRRHPVVLGSAQLELWPEPSSPARMRASGGGAMLSGPWLLRAAVLLPTGHELAQRGPEAAASWFGDVLRRWLQAQGIGGAAVYAGPAIHHWAGFAARTPGDVLVGERKLVSIGLRWRPREVLLCSGVLLAPAPWPLLCAALRRPCSTAALLEGLSISAADCLGRQVDAGAWADGLRHALRLGLAQAAASLGK